MFYSLIFCLITLILVVWTSVPLYLWHPTARTGMIRRAIVLAALAVGALACAVQAVRLGAQPFVVLVTAGIIFVMLVIRFVIGWRKAINNKKELRRIDQVISDEASSYNNSGWERVGNAANPACASEN